MKTRADKIQEEAFERFGIEKTMKGTHFHPQENALVAARVLGIMLLFGAIAFLSLRAGGKQETAHVSDEEIISHEMLSR